MAATNLVRVLVVDDSPMIRSALQRALSAHPRIEVIGAASDGIDGLRKIAALRPDVVTLDVEMPNMNGIGVLERAAGKVPVAFVMVSTLTSAGARITLEALRKGAFDFVTKPSTSGTSREEFQADIQRKVIAAAATKNRKRTSTSSSKSTSAPKLPPNKIHGWIVGIGISCGGPQTLSEVLPAFPSDFVPVVVTQHMPAQFTGPFAAQLDGLCAMRVVEAKHGMPIEMGTIYISPGSHHLLVKRVGMSLRLELDAGEKVSGHRPSADVMLSSIAQSCPSRSIGVVMTGMGADGAKGLATMHRSGAWTIAQDEETSLVYGMPKVAASTGEVDHVVAMQKIPLAISRLMQRGPRANTASNRSNTFGNSTSRR